MKLVLLTAHSPDGEVQHRYVAHHLRGAFGPELAAIIVATGLPKPLWKKAEYYFKRYSTWQIVSRTLLLLRNRFKGRNARRQEAYARILFPNGEDGHMPDSNLDSSIVRLVPSHNGKECLELLNELQPDIIAVYGTMIIGQAVIAQAKVSIINMHTGLSPLYRGSDTIYWALHNAEPENVGVTVHRLNSGVDAGAILATAKPAISPDDTEDTLFAKCVSTGTPLFEKAIRDEAAGIAAAVPQNLDLGREYRSIERTLWSELVVEKNIANGLIRNFRGEASDKLRK